MILGQRSCLAQIIKKIFERLSVLVLLVVYPY